MDTVTAAISHLLVFADFIVIKLMFNITNSYINLMFD